MDATTRAALGKRVLAGTIAIAGIVAAVAFAKRPIRVDVVRATRGPIVETIVASGRVQPAERVALAFESLGTVVSVSVSEGARVRRGEVLVQLDDARAHASVEQARAALAQAEASVARIRGLGARLAGADQRAAAIALASARDREQRQRTLETGGATTASEVADAVRTRESAEVALGRATDQSSGVGPGGGDVRVASAAREGAQAALRAAQATLDRMALRAPFDGIVLMRRVEPGQVVQPGATLLELASSGPTEVVVNADESHLARLAVGQRADASADAYPDRRFVAKVASIAPAIDPLRGTVEVKLALTDPPAYLRPDMTVSIEIETGRAENALLLPNTVVHDLASAEPWVYVARSGAIARQSLRLGFRGDARVAVTSGLDASMDVVLGDVSALSEGQRVRTRRIR